MKNNSDQNSPLCPSARPEIEGSRVFGIITGTVENPHVTYLKQSLPVTEELMAMSAPVTPTEVFRTAAPCIQNGCRHFDGQNCRLAMRVVEQLTVVEEHLPPCSIRKECRWFQQEGKAACLRCPQVITDNYNASDLVRQVATGIINNE
ncbi:conserved hypothetical protein [Gloeothece citriformis PCC 7424]|uniref:Nitrogen fixation protein n=1 Tax=Gloeothece citriformis (strain PCC 7424) TaxID=65393 RepID=B7KE87_GLOC7|nr:hypothetical protein [Gloeothece citriformis]ACK73205.1 conserved hypothetical protein [Gloeothece citriformis PCC 7424]